MIPFTFVACLVALGASIFPGVLSGLICVVSLLVPVAMIGLAVSATISRMRRRREEEKVKAGWPWRRLRVVAATVVMTYVLITFNIPCRIVFAWSRSAFERYLPTAAVSEMDGQTLQRRLGLYYVDQYAADRRGGVYFRTTRGNDGVGPDVMSYGFAYRPNPTGTPFGAARYQYQSMGNDWYWFRASDDWR